MAPQIICPYCKECVPLEGNGELINGRVRLNPNPYSCPCGAKGTTSYQTAHGIEPPFEEVDRDFESGFRGTEPEEYTSEENEITETDPPILMFWWKPSSQRQSLGK
jgi:hypothetical protein